MPHEVRLTDTAVRNAKPTSKPYKLTDGGGLYLLVTPTGSKLWRYKYRIAGKEGTYAIGAYPTLGSQARVEHAKSRELVSTGTHPRHHRQTECLRRLAESANTFEAVAKDWIAKNSARWSPYYLRQVQRFMVSDVFPQIGTLPFGQVTSAHILKVIKQAEARGAETVALLIRQWCSAIFRYAVQTLSQTKTRQPL